MIGFDFGIIGFDLITNNLWTLNVFRIHECGADANEMKSEMRCARMKISNFAFQLIVHKWVLETSPKEMLIAESYLVMKFIIHLSLKY